MHKTTQQREAGPITEETLMGLDGSMQKKVRITQIKSGGNNPSSFELNAQIDDLEREINIVIGEEDIDQN